MKLVLCAIIALVFAAGVFLILRRNLIKVIIGLGLIGNAVNLSIFAVNGWKLGSVPIIDPKDTNLGAAAIDPLPQALVLTAIVIGLAMQAFLLVLARLNGQESGSDDPQELEDGSR